MHHDGERRILSPTARGADHHQVRQLTTGQAADLLGVGGQTIRTLAASGDLAYRRTAGGHRRFLEADVLAFRGRALTPPSTVPGSTRASVWAAAAIEVLTAAQRDMGPDSDAGKAFTAASDLLVARLRDAARDAAPPRRPRKSGRQAFE